MLVPLEAQLFKSSDKTDTAFLVCMMKKKVHNFIELVLFF